RPRAVGAESVRRGIGIALLDHDVAGGNADLGGNDLRPGRLMTLALALGADAGDARARRVQTDFAGVEHRDAEYVAVLRRAGADNLGEERQSEPHDLPSLAALKGLALRRLFLAQAGIVDGLHHLAHGRMIVAGIVFP